MSDLNDPVYYALIEAKVALLLAKPFYGSLAGSLILKEAPAWCRTAATDGKFFYYNREFIKSLTKKELIFLFGHEVLHCVYDHLGRRKGKKPGLWNMATDYLINYSLVKEGVGTMPKVGLYKERFTDDMTSEEIYYILENEKAKEEETLDQHLELGSDGDESGEGSGQPGGEGSGMPKLSEEEMEKIRQRITADVLRTAQCVGAGDIPGGIRRMIDALVTPKMDWRTLLDATLRSSIREDYTFQRLSRRSHGSGFLLPAQGEKETIDVVVAMDVSGSMTDTMLRDQLSEVKGIMQTFGEFKLTLFCFDTRVYNLREYHAGNIDEIDEYPIDGGGGTLFECCWEFMKENEIQPHRFVMFTDGYPGRTWGDEEYCETLFVIYGNHAQNIVAPFGQTAYYEPSADAFNFVKRAA